MCALYYIPIVLQCSKHCGVNLLPAQQHLLPVRRLAVEAAGGGERELAERLTFMVADDQPVLLEGPFAAGVEISRTAAFGGNRAFAFARRRAESHDASAALRRRKV